MRGEIAQSSFDLNETIIVEGNVSIPKVPKLTYVNFDASTLAMDDVGERPWDRAFFRDTALALIERGNARVLSFDFGFTPKSMSSMVPEEKSSPRRVIICVLGSMLGGVFAILWTVLLHVVRR